jgi:putative effector of murein hydrolase LrgA (UPF0299 family)
MFLTLCIKIVNFKDIVLLAFIYITGMIWFLLSVVLGIIDGASSIRFVYFKLIISQS